MAKTCLPAGHFSQRAGTVGLTPLGKTIFSLLYNWILAEERYLWGASPAVLCKTGLCKIIETKGFKSTKTFSITWAMSGMTGMLISSRIFFFLKPLLRTSHQTVGPPLVSVISAAGESAHMWRTSELCSPQVNTGQSGKTPFNHF